MELALSDGKAPDSFAVVKIGKNKATVNNKVIEFNFSEADADAVIKEFADRGKKLVIDWEHQTNSGKRAPASGWVEKFKKVGKELHAVVESWTDAGRKDLETKQYRYMSPVILPNEKKNGWGSVQSLALTNHPALHQMQALVASDFNIFNTKTEDNKMNEELLKMLKLSDISETAQPAKAVKVVQELIDNQESTKSFLKLHDAETLDALTLKIGGMVSLADHQALKKDLDKIESEKVVELALTDGKITEAQKEWAMGVALKDLDIFKGLMKDAPKVTPGTAPKQKQTDQGSALSLSDHDRKILEDSGLSDKQIEEIEAERKK